LLSFGPTLLFLPLIFLGGYYFFATVWVPRLVCTLKARAWLTTYAVALAVPSEVWPEIFLMFVQFGGLVLVVWSLGLPAGETSALKFNTPAVREVAGFTSRGEALLFLWSHRRGEFLTPRGVALTGLVNLVLGGAMGASTPVGKTWPTLREKLRPALLMSEARSPVHPG